MFKPKSWIAWCHGKFNPSYAKADNSILQHKENQKSNQRQYVFHHPDEVELPVQFSSFKYNVVIADANLEGLEDVRFDRIIMSNSSSCRRKMVSNAYILGLNKLNWSQRGLKWLLLKIY